jgi:ribokinase
VHAANRPALIQTRRITSFLMLALVMRCARDAALGETVTGRRFQSGFGGKGANQCVMAAKLGAHTAMVSRVGTDSFGTDAVANFRACGVSVDHVLPVAGVSTGVAPIIVDSAGNNMIVVVGGANDRLMRDAVDAASQLISCARVCVCQNEVCWTMHECTDPNSCCCRNV